jgi:hypothetical protein
MIVMLMMMMDRWNVNYEMIIVMMMMITMLTITTKLWSASS